MSTYVMSDLHGCFDAFMAMLENIDFTESDTLILAGDYIDRGQQNAKMLRWLESRPANVICIKGNHDVEFAENIALMTGLDKREGLGTDSSSGQETAALYDSMKYMLKGYNSDATEYFDLYGGIRQMIESGAVLDDLIRWSKMLQQMPYMHELDVNGRHCMIVHAGYIEDLSPVREQYSDIRDFYLYAREEAYLYGGRAHCTIIAGHTPTITANQFTYHAGRVFRYYDEQKDCTFYDIDCGCSFRSRNEHAALACLRLEDESVYYV